MSLGSEKWRVGLYAHAVRRQVQRRGVHRGAALRAPASTVDPGDPSQRYVSPNRQPNVNELASAPESRNSIVNVRSFTPVRWRMS